MDKQITLISEKKTAIAAEQYQELKKPEVTESLTGFIKKNIVR